MKGVAIYLAAVLLLFTVYSSSAAKFATKTNVDEELKRHEEETIEATKEKLAAFAGQPRLRPFNDIAMPFIPMIAGGGVSLSLAEVQVIGLTDTTIQSIDDEEVNGLTISSDMLTLYAGNYVAGGHFNNLPFVGESQLNVSIVAFQANITYEVDSKCVVPGSVLVQVLLGQLKVKFENLNPGTDSGDLINAVFSTMADDISQGLNNLLEVDGKWHDAVDTVLVKLINSMKPLCKAKYSGDTAAEFAQQLFEELFQKLQTIPIF